MALNCTETACWVTPNDSASSFCFDSDLLRVMLVEVYGDTAPTDKSYREWFRRFMDFSVEDKLRSGQPKKFEDKELEALLEEDQSQTQEELAESLRITSRFCTIESYGNDSKTRKLGALWNWNRETLKGDFSLAKSWFKDNREKVFCIGLWLIGDEKWIFYDNPKKKKYYAKPGQSLPSLTSTSTSRPNIHDSEDHS